VSNRKAPLIDENGQRILRAIARASAGNVALALSRLCGHDFEIREAGVRLLPLAAVPGRFGGEERPVSAIRTDLTGSVAGTLLLAIEPPSAASLVCRLVGRAPDSLDRLSPLQESALLETGNILAGAFCDALARDRDDAILISIPEIAIDMAASILQTPLIEQTDGGDEAVLIECVLAASSPAGPLTLHLMLIPAPDSVRRMIGPDALKAEQGMGGSSP